MDIEIHETIYIDIDSIISDNKLNKDSTLKDITNAVIDYVCELNDYEYYLMTEEHSQKVINRIAKILKKEK